MEHKEPRCDGEEARVIRVVGPRKRLVRVRKTSEVFTPLELTDFLNYCRAWLDESVEALGGGEYRVIDYHLEFTNPHEGEYFAGPFIGEKRALFGSKNRRTLHSFQDGYRLILNRVRDNYDFVSPMDARITLDAWRDNLTMRVLKKRGSDLNL